MNDAHLHLATSVKQRLLNLATRRREDFNLIQVRYATERLLYRLSVSPYAQEFLLKGAMLFVLWETQPHRPTRDIDLLFLQPYDALELANIFRKVALTVVPPDGVLFDEKSVQAAEIREDNSYGGIRVKMIGCMGSSRIPIQIDIGLGDAVHPQPVWCDFTTLLEFPVPYIRSYPVETVVAEKLQAIVELGNRNTRMKDYFDILYLLRRFEFSGVDLQIAIHKTFLRRRTTLPIGIPDGLSPSFSTNSDKQKQWEAFLRKNHLAGEAVLIEVCDEIANFALPSARLEPFKRIWYPAHGWK